ncbi:hypothetical protein BJX64DRAFT_268132 [Aspergillus heterothallicus]
MGGATSVWFSPISVNPTVATCHLTLIGNLVGFLACPRPAWGDVMGLISRHRKWDERPLRALLFLQHRGTYASRMYDRGVPCMATFLSHKLNCKKSRK